MRKRREKKERVEEGWNKREWKKRVEEEIKRSGGREKKESKRNRCVKSKKAHLSCSRDFHVRLLRVGIQCHTWPIMVVARMRLRNSVEMRSAARRKTAALQWERETEMKGIERCVETERLRDVDTEAETERHETRVRGGETENRILRE